jgi:hypothetical protein
MGAFGLFWHFPFSRSGTGVDHALFDLAPHLESALRTEIFAAFSARSVRKRIFIRSK